MIIHNFDNLRKVIETNFSSVIMDEVQFFFQLNGDSEIFKHEGMDNPDVEIRGCKITDLTVDDVIDHDFVIVCKVAVDYVLSGLPTEHWDVYDVQKRVYLKMTMQTEFDEMLEDIFVESISVMSPYARLKHRGLETEKLLPRIYTEGDADRYAKEFLTEFYPAALTTPMPLPMMEILKRMRLIAKSGKLEGGNLGRCYFADEEGENDKIRKGTVVYDCDNTIIGRRRNNFTLAHEGAHWYCNRGYFARLNIIDPDFASLNYSGMDYYDYSGSYAHDRAIMEWQANALASRILMPETTARQKFIDIVEDISLWGETDCRKIYAKAIKEFARFYDVTISAAKIRLLELGFNDIRGIYDYVDNHYTRRYLYNPNRLNAHETYSISQKDFIRLSYEDDTIRELLISHSILKLAEKVKCFSQVWLEHFLLQR